jgi:hypothetical protein
MSAQRAGSSKLQEHWSVVRDAAVGAAVLVYFVGFVYLYYYLRIFGVSLIAVQLAPQHIFAFSYDVLAHRPILTITAVLTVFVAALGYSAAMEWMDKQRARRPWSADSLIRSTTMFVGLAAMLLTFPIAFWWAQQVARDDGKQVLQRAHAGSRRHLRLIENQGGTLVASTPEFRAIVHAVNMAGVEGRAIKVAESADQVFILVGDNNDEAGGSNDPGLYKHGDTVYAIDKSLIAIQEEF